MNNQDALEVEESNGGYEYEIIGAVLVDSGQIEIGDCGSVHVTVPTTHGDGIYPVSLVTNPDGSRTLLIELDNWLFDDDWSGDDEDE